MAGYSGSTDSLIILNPEDYVKPAYIVEELDMTTVSALNTEKYNTVLAEKDIFATTDTVYFYYNTKGNVTTWTGYKNAPSSVTLYSSDIAYTVAHKSASTDKYYVADVIVIEQKGSDKSASFLYDAYQRNTGWVVTTISGTADGWDTAAITSGLKAVNTTNTYAWPAFYEIGKSADEVTKNYADYNIYAAESETNANVNVRDYVYLTNNPGVSSFLTTSVEVYKVAYKNGDYSIANCKTIAAGDRLIYVTDGKSVEYVINVTESYYTDKNGRDIYFLVDLYEDIIEDQGVRTGDVDVIFFGQEATFSPADDDKVEGVYTWSVSYADAKAYVEKYPAADTLRVNGGRIIAGDSTAKLTLGLGTYAGTILSDTGKYYMFVLTQDPAESQAMLLGQYVARTSLNDDYGYYYELTIPARFTIQDYLNSFDLSDGATVDWYFVTTGNTEIKFSGMKVPDLDKTIYNGVTTSEIKYVWAHVTSDDGKVENDFMNSKYFDEVFSRFDAKAVITAVHTPQTVLTKDSSTQSAALTTETYTLSVPKNFDKNQLDPQKIGNSIINVAWTHAKNTSVTRDGNVITVKADSDWRGRGYEATITIVERSNPTFGVTAWSASASGNLCVAVWCNDYYYSEDFDALYAPGELLREDDLEDLLDGIDQDNFKLYWNNDTHTAANAPIYETAAIATYHDFTDPVHQYVTSHDYGFVKLTFLNEDNSPAIGSGSTFNGQNGDTIDANTGVFRLTLNGVNVAQVYAAIAIPTT